MTLTIPRGTKKPVVWSIAGSDSSASAGLQTDLKTITALGAHACTIVTSVTAQNTGKVQGFESVSPTMLKAQIDALHDDLPPQAIKIGMLGNAESVAVLAESLASIDAYTIYDPVLIASSGTRLLDDETIAVMREKLLPCIDLLTPNIAEAEALTSIPIRSDEDVEKAAAILLETGVTAVLVKGWNSGTSTVQDYFHGNGRAFWLTLPEHKGEVARGTGCAFASTLAAAYAFGFDEADAAVIAKATVHRGLRLAQKIGKGPPIAEHHPWPPASADFPWLTPSALEGRMRLYFPGCGTEPLSFYPIVDNVAWLYRLLPRGVRTAQLRIKNLQGEALESAIIAAIELARKTGTRLFINDH